MEENKDLGIPQVPESPINTDKSKQTTQGSLYDLAASAARKIIEMLTQSVDQQTKKTVKKVAQAAQAYTRTTLPQLAEVAVALIKSVANFRQSSLSDEEANQLVESNRVWGEYGWTYMPSMPITMFDTPPANIAEANKLAMQYCAASEMEKVFAELQKCKLNHNDLNSAIFCYQNRQYKACALLLCGLIDSKVIRVRSDENRPTGERAVKAIKKNYDSCGEKILAEAMLVYNLLSYLEVLFKRGYGFLHEPDVLNRNFIGHGMNRRTVRKRDCIQLFLALYNLLKHFEIVARRK